MDDKYTTIGDELLRDRIRPSDWFHTIQTGVGALRRNNHETIAEDKPENDVNKSGYRWTSAMHRPNTIKRLAWFLSVNRTRLLHDLLKVVNLHNINHENICCLNTAIFITIFAHRRRELHVLLRNLKRTDEYEAKLQHEADDAILRKDQMMDNTISRAMTNMYID